MIPVAKPERVVAHSEDFALGDRLLNEFPVWHAPYATYAQVWPKPFYEDRKQRVFYLKNATLTFKFTHATSDVLSKAAMRTHSIVSQKAVSVSTDFFEPKSKMLVLRNVFITAFKRGEYWPHLFMDESYRLEVDPNGIKIWANEQWGILRGLETLTHLIWQNKDGEVSFLTVLN